VGRAAVHSWAGTREGRTEGVSRLERFSSKGFRQIQKHFSSDLNIFQIQSNSTLV
jgi:hypothetical protein